MLADYLVNELHHVRQDLEKLPVIVSGGGILVPGMEKAIWREINDILKLSGFSWLSNGKDSCWLKLSS